MAAVIYYIDENGNFYVDSNGNNYIAGNHYSESPTKLQYLQYKPYRYNSTYGKTTAYLYKNGEWIKVKPYIFTNTEIAIAGLAIAGIARSGANTIYG